MSAGNHLTSYSLIEGIVPCDIALLPDSIMKQTPRL